MVVGSTESHLGALQPLLTGHQMMTPFQVSAELETTPLRLPVIIPMRIAIISHSIQHTSFCLLIHVSPLPSVGHAVTSHIKRIILVAFGRNGYTTHTLRLI
jgi:hypothetical protein